MHADQHSSPAVAQARSTHRARDGPGRHRARGRRPGRTMARISIAAGATVGATVVALASAAGPAGAATKPAWIMTAGNVQRLSQTAPSTMSHFFNTSASYGVGASLVRTPVQAGYATTPVLSYTSYSTFKSDIQSGAIGYPYKWVMYDPEKWSATPVGEQQNPVRYMTLFGQLAHAHRLKVIQAPALDLGSVTRSVLPRQRGETINQWYVRVNIAGAAAAAGDIYQLQDESNTTAGLQYARMFDTTQAQAQAANPKVLAFSEVSTVNGTTAQMATAAQSISPAGIYVAAAGNLPKAEQFFKLMKAADY